MSQLLKVGKIANTHGLKGEVKVIALTDDPKRFNDLEYVIIEGKTISVEGCKFQKDRVIVKLEGIDRIEDAERLKNKFMEIHREDAVELEEDEYYIADLIGMDVITDEGEEGKLVDVIETGANEVYVVEFDKYGEVLIPAIHDCILDVDIEAMSMKVHLLEGLV